MGHSFVIGITEYVIEVHGQGYGGDRYAAANIRLENFGSLPKTYQRKLNRLYAVNWTNAQAVDQNVWEDFTESWWDRFRTDAVDEGLGKVYSAGRSGGWLVLNDYPESRLERLLELVRIPCQACDKTFSTHVGLKCQCLFSSTSFTDPDDTDFDELQNAADTLVRVANFLKKCEDDVGEYSTPDYVHTLKYVIDGLWESYRESAKSHRVLQAKAG